MGLSLWIATLCGMPGVVVGRRRSGRRVGRDLEGVLVEGDPRRGQGDLAGAAAAGGRGRGRRAGRRGGGVAGGRRRGRRTHPSSSWAPASRRPASRSSGRASRWPRYSVPVVWSTRRVGERAGGPDEGDQLLDLAVVERALRLEPGQHQRVRVAADVAAADGEHGCQVLRGQVGQELGLVVQDRPDAALARGRRGSASSSPGRAWSRARTSVTCWAAVSFSIRLESGMPGMPSS